MIVGTVARNRKPYLPQDLWLSVNTNARSEVCKTVADYKFVLTRLRELRSKWWYDDDMDVCGNGGELSSETKVYNDPAAT